MENRLTRSTQERMFAGVCGGLARYLQVEVLLVRLFFVVFTLVGGIGPLVYIILWIVVPTDEASGSGAEPAGLNGKHFEERMQAFGKEFEHAIEHPHKNAGLYVGIGLVLLGVFFFLKMLNPSWFAWVNREVILAGLLVLAGAALLLVTLRRRK